MKNKYPEEIMKVLREDLLLNDDDIKYDEKINKYKPDKVFKKLLLYKHNLILWGVPESEIKKIIKNANIVYDIK